MKFQLAFVHFLPFISRSRKGERKRGLWRLTGGRRSDAVERERLSGKQQSAGWEVGFHFRAALLGLQSSSDCLEASTLSAPVLKVRDALQVFPRPISNNVHSDGVTLLQFQVGEIMREAKKSQYCSGMDQQPTVYHPSGLLNFHYKRLNWHVFQSLKLVRQEQ